MQGILHDLHANLDNSFADAVGDLCYSDQDCGQISKADGTGGWTTTNAAACRNHTCACADSTHVPDISGLYCATGEHQTKDLFGTSFWIKGQLNSQH